MSKYHGHLWKDCPNCGRGGCEAPYVLRGGSKIRTAPWECAKCGWTSLHEEKQRELAYTYIDEDEASVGSVIDDVIDVVARQRRY